jgi:hypothetical protein
MQQQQRQTNPSQNSIQRLMMQQSLPMKPDCRVDPQIDQVQHTQVLPATPISHGAESGSPGLLPQNHEALAHDPTAITSTPEPLISPKANFVENETPLVSASQGILQRQLSGGLPMHGSPKGNFVGNETPLPPSSQSMLQRQLSGGLPMHGQDAGGSSWHHQQFRPPHLQPPNQQQAQHQHEASALVDPAAVTSTSELLISPKASFVGNEIPSSQGMLQRQLSGGLPIHGQDVGGLSWHQQQLRPPHLQPPHHQQPQHQQRPVAPGSLYAPSDSGSG